MGIVNISEYKNNGDGYKCYFGKTSLKKGYYFADGDESFYALVGENSCYSMTELLYRKMFLPFFRMYVRTV